MRPTMAYRCAIGFLSKHRGMTDSPEPFLYRLRLSVLVSLAAAALVPVDLAFDEEPTAGYDDTGRATTPGSARR